MFKVMCSALSIFSSFIDSQLDRVSVSSRFSYCTLYGFEIASILFSYRLLRHTAGPVWTFMFLQHPIGLRGITTSLLVNIH